MHVLHVMEATIGGTRRHLVDVSTGQLEAGHRVSLAVATLRDPGFLADLEALERAGAHVVRIPMVRAIRPAKDLRHLRRLRKLMLELRPDVVHTHSSKAGVLGRRASMSAGVGARVHTPHTFAFLFDALFSRAKRALFRSIERGLARSTHRMVAVSASEAERMGGSGVVDPAIVRVVPNGVDPARMEGAKPVDISEFGLEPSLACAAIIGLVYGAKGQDLAIEALAQPGLEGLQLLCVGPGDASDLEARAAELGVARRVAFTGPRDDVPRILAAADFLALPSRWEAMPYVVLEAMAASRTVVATPVDGARDLVLDGETGFLARAASVDGVADALQRALLAGAGTRDSMGRAGRARLDQGYSLRAMIQGLDEVYREAMEEAGR